MPSAEDRSLILLSKRAAIGSVEEHTFESSRMIEVDGDAFISVMKSSCN